MLFMNLRQNVLFELNEDNDETTQNVYPFVPGQRYNGFLFNFADFVIDQDVSVLLDSPGKWHALITLYADGVVQNVQGMVEFYVEGTNIEYDPYIVSLDDIMNNIARELSSRAVRFVTVDALEGDLSEGDLEYLNDNNFNRIVYHNIVYYYGTTEGNIKKYFSIVEQVGGDTNYNQVALNVDTGHYVISSVLNQHLIDYLKDYIDTQDASKADKVVGATSGHLAGLDETGNLTDSGIASNNVVTKDGTQTITGAKHFTGVVGNDQSAPGVYLGLDSNPNPGPNANIAIVSGNNAAYIDMGAPNEDYGFRIIKWNESDNTNAQLIYNIGGTNYAVTVPKTTDTLAVVGDITNAINGLDKNDITGFGPDKTLATLTEENGVINATFQSIQIAKSQVTNLENDLSSLDGRLDDIEELIPEQATSSNQLADKEFVNSSIATNTATFRGTYNIVTDLGLTTSATEEQIAAAITSKLASLSITPTKNDYVFVAYPDEDTQELQYEKYDRYKYSGSIWEYEYTLNNSSFTAAQWAAINSGITSGLVEQISTNETDITNLGNTKADKVSNAVAGNIAGLDANGNLTDSGIASSEVALVSDIPTNYVTTDTAQTITGEKTILDTYIDFKKTGLNNYWSVELEQYENLEFARNHAAIYKMGSQAFFPASNNARDLGTSDLKWKDLYLSGNAYFGATNVAVIKDPNNNRLYVNISGTTRFKIGGSSIISATHFVPDANNTYDLGHASLSWNNLQMTGLIKNGNVTYGIGLPVMTNWIANKEVATTDLIFYKPFTPPSTLTLTDDEYNTIINGCILDSDWVVNGTTHFAKGCIFYAAWPYNNSMRGTYIGGSKVSTYLIDTTTKTITASGADDINIRGVAKLNASEVTTVYIDSLWHKGIKFAPGVPDQDQDLGDSTTHRWNNLYLKGSISDGTNSITVANIASKTYADAATSTAISALDVPSTGDGAITGFGTDKTLATLTETDGIISATFQSIQITENQVTNLTTDLDNKLDKKPDGTHDLISNNKISTTYIPDSILGQLVYGGTVTGAGVATLSTNAQSRLGTASTSITLTNDTTAITGYAANEGIFYVVSSNGSFASLGLKTGDWLISTGLAWQKVDNTDEVTSVQVSGTTGEIVSSTDTSQTGNVSTTISLANNYGDNKNPYASKTANTVLAAPDNSNGAPTFRALTERDIPTLAGTKIAVANATDGHLAGLNSAGNVTDSGVAANNVVTLDGAQTISGAKTFSNEIILAQDSGYYTKKIYFGAGNNKAYFSTYQGGSGTGNYFFDLNAPSNSVIRFTKNIELRPNSNQSNIGNSSYPWKDLYLSGKVDFGAKVSGRTASSKIDTDLYDGIALWINGVRNVIFYDNASYFSKPIFPNTTGVNIGGSASRFANVFAVNLNMSGTLFDGNNANYGLSLPDTTNFTSNETVATTSDLPQIKRYI